MKSFCLQLSSIIITILWAISTIKKVKKSNKEIPIKKHPCFMITTDGLVVEDTTIKEK